ncbi:hypothetical protein ACIBJF_03115 [Streptomyces sp. NPDC050743]|uniref:hypothetical protein n=1 Tax=Streptomyces sp. NPDC050743 TaxID=3365634 RepID=UPI00378A4510
MPKNAIDCLFAEWDDKANGIVPYGDVAGRLANRHSVGQPGARGEGWIGVGRALVLAGGGSLGRSLGPPPLMSEER